MLDDITQAVLAREEVARYLRGGPGQTELQARDRLHAYLDQPRGTSLYRVPPGGDGGRHQPVRRSLRGHFPLADGLIPQRLLQNLNSRPDSGEGLRRGT